MKVRRFRAASRRGRDRCLTGPATDRVRERVGDHGPDGRKAQRAAGVLFVERLLALRLSQVAGAGESAALPEKNAGAGAWAPERFLYSRACARPFRRPHTSPRFPVPDVPVRAALGSCAQSSLPGEGFMAER